MADKLIVLLPGVTMCFYFLTSLAFLWKRDFAWALIYVAYATANIGLIWASLK